jgi:hypothetical protein
VPALAPEAGQSTLATTAQVPSGWQQAPVGAAAGHAYVAQVWFSCHTRIGATQAASVVSTQVPSTTLQQAKTGCGHGFGMQTSQASCQIRGEGQFASDVTVHVPTETQQAPCGGGGHEFGLHVVNSEYQVPGGLRLVQAVRVRRRQAPLGQQHAAGVGQGFGSQTTKLPW